MPWIVNFEDGTATNSRKGFWTSLPKDRKLKGLSLQHPQISSLKMCLSGLDAYYFVRESIAFFGKEGRVVAEIIGGHDLKLGVGIEIRLEETGTIKHKIYPLDLFRYNPDILRQGARQLSPITPAALEEPAPAEKGA